MALPVTSSLTILLVFKSRYLKQEMQCGDTVALWLVRSTPDRVVWVQAWTGDFVFFS